MTLLNPDNFRRFLRRAVALPLVLVALLTIVLVWQIADLLAGSRREAHANAVSAQANLTERLLIDAETGQRGYLVSGNLLFLQPYIEAQQTVRPAFDKLLLLCGSNRAQADIVLGIRYVYGRWERDAKTLIRLRQLNTSYQVEFNRGIGKTMMDAMREQFSIFLAEETRLAHLRAQQTQRSTRVTFAVGLSLAALFATTIAGALRNMLGRLAHDYDNALQTIGESEERFRSLIVASSQIVWTTNPAGEMMPPQP